LFYTFISSAGKYSITLNDCVCWGNNLLDKKITSGKVEKQKSKPFIEISIRATLR
jgi:hypothetical protein